MGGLCLKLFFWITIWWNRDCKATGTWIHWSKKRHPWFHALFFPAQEGSHLAKPWSCRIPKQKVAEPKYMLFFVFALSSINGKFHLCFLFCVIKKNQDLLGVTKNVPYQRMWPMIWKLCLNSLRRIVSANSKAPREISLHASGNLKLCLFLDVLNTGGLRSKSCTSWIRID